MRLLAPRERRSVIQLRVDTGSVNHESEMRGMPESNNVTDGSIELGAVRDALRAELTSRGFDVASDTLGLRREIYVIGDNDLAKALFHLDTDAEEAADSIYRSSGSWVDGMPARFAVLPASEAGDPIRRDARADADHAAVLRDGSRTE